MPPGSQATKQVESPSSKSASKRKHAGSLQHCLQGVLQGLGFACMMPDRRIARSDAGSRTRSFSEPCWSARVTSSILATLPGIAAAAYDSSLACVTNPRHWVLLPSNPPALKAPSARGMSALQRVAHLLARAQGIASCCAVC